MNYKAKVMGDVFRSGKKYAAGVLGVAVFLGGCDVAWKKLNRRDAEQKFKAFKQQQDLLRQRKRNAHEGNDGKGSK